MQKTFDKALFWVFPSKYLILIMMFFMPFTMVSCNSPDDFKLSGYEFTGLSLITGTTIEYEEPVSGFSGFSGFTGESRKRRTVEKIEPNLLAIFSIMVAFSGLVISFIPKGPARFSCATLSIAGLFLLINLKTQLRNEAFLASGGLINVEFLSAYWISLFLFAGTALTGIYLGIIQLKEIEGNELSVSENENHQVEQTQKKPRKSYNPDDYLPKHRK